MFWLHLAEGWLLFSLDFFFPFFSGSDLLPFCVIWGFLLAKLFIGGFFLVEVLPVEDSCALSNSCEPRWCWNFSSARSGISFTPFRHVVVKLWGIVRPTIVTSALSFSTDSHCSWTQMGYFSSPSFVGNWHAMERVAPGPKGQDCLCVCPRVTLVR